MWTFQSKKSVQLGVICQICLKIWYVVIDILLGTITVVFPATTRTLFLVVYRLPAATVAPLLKDFVCKKNQYIIIAGLYHSWLDVFSKTVLIAGLTKSLNEMIFIFSINICLIQFFFVHFFAKKWILSSLQNIVLLN